MTASVPHPYALRVRGLARCSPSEGMGSNSAAAPGGERVALSDVVTREQYKTAEGRSASAYRTHLWNRYPIFKNCCTLLACSTTTFVVGPGLVAGALWACPRPVSWLAGAVYCLHVLFGNAMHTGSLENFWWKSLDLHMAVLEYFGYRLLVEDDLALRADRKYIVGTHPHGVYALGQLPFMFTSRHNPLFQLFPFLANKVHGTGASVVFYIPGIREMFLLAGHVVVSKRTLIHWLKREHSVGIVVGGEAECLAAANNDDSLVLGGRKGFVRLALSEGADLLPTYCFHNTDVFSINTTLWQGLRAWLKQYLKISIPIYYGWMGTPFPHQVPLSLAIGAPIPVPVVEGTPPDDLVEEYYQKYVEAIQQLYRNHRAAAGYPADRTLKILDAPEHGKKRKTA